MAKLGTHKERMLAIEEIYDTAQVMEKAALIELVNRLSREEEYKISPVNSINRTAMGSQISH